MQLALDLNVGMQQEEMIEKVLVQKDLSKKRRHNIMKY
jgi:hypothetical protein